MLCVGAESPRHVRPVKDTHMTPAERLRTLPVSFMKELPRFILIGLFSLAAIDKLIHFQGFVAAIHSYYLVPSRLESFAATFFIMAEFAIALGLLTKRWRRAASLSAVFVNYIHGRLSGSRSRPGVWLLVHADAQLRRIFSHTAKPRLHRPRHPDMDGP